MINELSVSVTPMRTSNDRNFSLHFSHETESDMSLKVSDVKFANHNLPLGRKTMRRRAGKGESIRKVSWISFRFLFFDSFQEKRESKKFPRNHRSGHCARKFFQHFPSFRNLFEGRGKCEVSLSLSHHDFLSGDPAVLCSRAGPFVCFLVKNRIQVLYGRWVHGNREGEMMV